MADSPWGYGATKFALKYPNLFAFAGSFSGALAAAYDADFKPRIGEKYSRDMEEILGPREARAGNDVYALAEKANPPALPYFWLACGTEDFLLDSNRKFVALLHQRKVPYTYTEARGAHTWEFWDEELPAMLRELARHVNVGAARQ